ncbi:MAG: hypothetical protein K2O12_04930 [Muribaculaceae bacterium]|nr:hypothetical protein [Muribaculaceae bacterium]
MKHHRSPNAFFITFIAVIILLCMSFLPWSNISGNFFKDFNLLEDICSVKTHNEGNGEIVDPELLALMNNDDNGIQNSKNATDPDTIIHSDTSYRTSEQADSIDNSDVPESFSVPMDGDLVLIEDYSPSRNALSRFSKAIASASVRPVRIAIIGDSYIEGDVFSQDVREKLQSLYGGRGAGYMMMHSDIPGFRQSVTQTDKGWTPHDVRKTAKLTYKWLAGEYFIGNQGATSSYKGVSRKQHADEWNTSKFLYIAPSPGSVSITTDSGTVEYPIQASESVQCITVSGNTKKYSIRNNASGLVALGVWLSDSTGISLDCMSLRGNSGISHRTLNESLASAMSEHIPYDLIIVEYGINALSSAQKDYSKYGGYMEDVITTLRTCYPDADILMMGIGDRGQKSGSEVHSIATAQNMVDTQRKVASRTGIAFWDTRAAMGGDDAIVDWREKKLVNADYIHLNHKGGEALAQLLVDALSKAISE